jgi:hypothetical protein
MGKDNWRDLSENDNYYTNIAVCDAIIHEGTYEEGQTRGNNCATVCQLSKLQLFKVANCSDSNAFVSSVPSQASLNYEHYKHLLLHPYPSGIVILPFEAIKKTYGVEKTSLNFKQKI